MPREQGQTRSFPIDSIFAFHSLRGKISQERGDKSFEISGTTMELQEALSMASQILNEERVSPTVNYDCVPQAEPGFAQAFVALAGTINLPQMRSQRPRQLIENPTWYRFKSTNYDLLCALLSRLTENNRQAFLSVVALRLMSAPGCIRKPHVFFPGWNNLSSDLPLVAEFLVRNHGKAQLVRALFESERIPGHAPLLRQLEEMIALNYTVFTDSDYETLGSAMLNISAREAAKETEHRKRNTVSVGWPEIGSVSATGLCVEIEAASRGIAEQCRKARYLYVKGSLSEGLNLEVNQDKIAVEQYIQHYGFPHTLIESLNEAERLYLHGTTPLEFKSSMGHLRSFLENVHSEAMPALYGKFGGSLPGKWGEGLTYLVQNNLLSTVEEKFVASLYGLISDEGVHALVAEKEYVRLARNFVIEYALLFLRKMEKLGIKVALAALP